MLVRGPEGPPALAARLREALPEGVLDVVPGRAGVTVYYDPLALSWEDLARALRAAARSGATGDGAGAVPGPGTPGPERADGPGAAGRAEGPGRAVEVPVLYGEAAGPDLEEAAARAGMAPAEYARRHAAGEYTALFLGFAPGFAYLGHLDPELRVPRLARPRPAVPAGAVGVADDLTAVYPGGTPGGWLLIGRTPLAVYDPRRARRCLIRAGDRVRFRPVDAATFARLEAEAAAQALRAEGEAAGGAEAGRPALAVLRPGSQTTVQDLGRWGYQDEGVPVAGAADPVSLVLANRLVGNPPGAAALEVAVLGLELEALAEVAVGLAGADLGARVNGRPLPRGQCVLLRPGDRLAFAGGGRGCRAYLAVAGGVAVPPVLGSRSTDLLGRLGGVEGRPLRAGDVVRAGRPPEPPRTLAGRRLRPEALADFPPEVTVRAVLGPDEDRFSRAAVAVFFSHPFAVTPLSDRMGLRLAGPPVAARRGEVTSEGTPPGSVQVPPGGEPIVLLSGCQTVGGYPRLATVIAADLHLLGQARPGYTSLRFQAVTLAAAHRSLAEQARLLAAADLVV